MLGGSRHPLVAKDLVMCTLLISQHHSLSLRGTWLRHVLPLDHFNFLHRSLGYWFFLLVVIHGKPVRAARVCPSSTPTPAPLLQPT